VSAKSTGLFFVASLLLLPAGCGGESGAGAGHKRGGRGGARVAPSVAVEGARVERVRDVLVAHAALEPEAHVEVPVRAAGEVVEVLVEAGASVTLGQVLLRVDASRADLRVEEAALSLAQAKTSLGRTQGLSKKGLATVEELDQANEAVAKAELALKAAALDRRDADLLSPINGVVTERHVMKGDTLTAGTVAFRVADREPLLLRARIAEADAERLAVGQKAVVQVGETLLMGEVIRVAPLVDLGSGTVVATVAVSEGISKIRIGRFSRLEIVVAEREGAITISQAALALRGEDDRVLVCESKGETDVVRQRDVRLGVRNGPRVEVLSGLKAGERVVVAAPDDLRDGAAVRAVNTNPEPGEGVAEVDSGT
jgi:membrane fusion protein, multidrug efflux system